MTERTQHPGRREVTDAELVQGIRAGDGRAIAMLYDRYSDRIHGFCHSRLRDVADAADATHDTFVAAVQRIDQLRDPERLRPWLYTIAQRHALATFRSRSRSTPMDDLTTLTDPTADTADAELQRAALIELVWDAADGLEDRDQLVLDLHLRHDLAGEELADALGVARDHAYTLASRARSRLGRAVGALVVARHGRAECRVLDDLLRDWTGGLSTTVRDSINKHVDRCEVCGERRSRLTDPAAMFAAVPMVAAPAALRSDVLTSLGVSAPGTTAGAAAPATVSSVALKLGALTLVAGGVIGGAIVVAGSLSTSGDSAAGEVMQAQEPPTSLRRSPSTCPVGRVAVLTACPRRSGPRRPASPCRYAPRAAPMRVTCSPPISRPVGPLPTRSLRFPTLESAATSASFASSTAFERPSREPSPTPVAEDLSDRAARPREPPSKNPEKSCRRG